MTVWLLKLGIPFLDNAVSGKLTFLPKTHWNGTTSFLFTVVDDGGTTSGGTTPGLRPQRR